MSENADTHVELDATAGWSGDTLVVNGHATVPDGALVSWEITHTRRWDVQEDGTSAVEGGQFGFTLDAHDWPKGPVEVWLGFQTILGASVHQPEHVIAVYGHNGEHMIGDQVVDTGARRRAEIVLSA